MSKNVQQEEPHIVKEFYIENTLIRIADNSCVSREEAKEIIKRISAMAQEALTAQYEKNLREKQGA